MKFDFRYEVADGIATITFDRPEVLNALTLDIYAQLRDLFEALRYDETVKAVLLTGSGRGFCSGGDVHSIIGALLEQDTRAHLEFTRMTGALVANMRLLDKPIIAALNGTTAGAGAVIALASDLRIASNKAKIAFLFTKVGLTGADMGAAYLLPRAVGLAKASELLMLGDKIDAEEAHRIGLFNEVVPHEKLMERATEIARRLADGPSFSIGMTKELLNNAMSMDLYTALDAEARAQTICMLADDFKEFHRAFSEKREPKFRGK